MNYEIYIEESSPVRVLSNVIDEIYQKEEYTIVSKLNSSAKEISISCGFSTALELRITALSQDFDRKWENRSSVCFTLRKQDAVYIA